ncbi:MAG TPA: nicotinamide mononucleotide transporter family protein, partial [Opitutus sp.]|nr:nicotinamide mononucleotide transporter family protein [Opitutus sp.]
GTLGWGEIMRRHTDAALPHWDAFILVFSLIAQWWQARKRLECWGGWMIVNVVAVGVYWAKDLRLFAGLYLVFFAMAVAGHLAWRKSMLAATSAGSRRATAAVAGGRA